MRDLALREAGQSVNVNGIDLSFINEGDLHQDKLRELIDKVDVLTAKVITPTFSTGENTRLFIQLLKKLEERGRGLDQGCRNQLASINADLRNMNQTYLHNNSDESTERLRMAHMVLMAGMGKSQAYNEYAGMIHAQLNNLFKLIRFLEGLLLRQEKHGAELKKDPSQIGALAYTYNECDKEWTHIRKSYLFMEKEKEQITNIQNWVSRVHLITGETVQLQIIRDYRIELGLAV